MTMITNSDPVVTLPSKARFSFQEARSAWGNCDWIGSGRMAGSGLKEVQEAVMLIAGLSTYEKECLLYSVRKCTIFLFISYFCPHENCISRLEFDSIRRGMAAADGMV